MKELVLVERARSDIDRVVGWYCQNGGSVIASQFVEELTAALYLVRQFPEMAVRVSSYRKKAMDSFPYSLLYRLEGDTIYLMAVAHQARKPYAE